MYYKKLYLNLEGTALLYLLHWAKNNVESPLNINDHKFHKPGK